MTIAPISFGRGIKVSAPRNVVDKIVDSANKDLTKANNKSTFDMCIKTIFFDSRKGDESARVYKTQNGDTYIFSGKEAQLMKIASSEADVQLNCYDKYLKGLDAPETYSRMKPQIDAICNDIISQRDSLAECLAENGQKNKSKAEIAYFSTPDTDKLIYTAEKSGEKEIISLDYSQN